MSETPSIPPSETQFTADISSGSIETTRAEMMPKEAHNSFMDKVKERFHEYNASLGLGVGNVMLGAAVESKLAIRTDIAAKWGNEILLKYLSPELIEKLQDVAPNITEYASAVVGDPTHAVAAGLVVTGCCLLGKAAYEGYKFNEMLSERE
jgi:hypothetical protein